MAKNLFGYNIKPSDLSMPLDGEEFVIRRLEGEVSSKYSRLKEESLAIEKSSSFPMWLSIVQVILFLAGVILFFGSVEALLNTGVSLAQKAANGVWWIFGTGAACLAVSVVLKVLERIKKKRVEESPGVYEFKERVRLLAGESAAMLRVPEDAAVADVFTFPYKMRFGRASSAVGTAKYSNAEVSIFREGDTLCIADLEQVIGIPLEKIEYVACVRRRVMFAGWNKQVSFQTGEMKKYKIKANSYGAYSVKPYYALFIRGSEEFYLLFPAYEWEAFAALLGSKARDIREIKKLL